MAELDPVLLQRQLMDIYQPESVSWWPLAPGWWLIIIGGLLSIVVLSRIYYKKTILRRVALEKIYQIERDYQRQPNLSRLAVSLNMLIRRIILSQPHRFHDFIAGCSGEDWLFYLDKTAATDAFSHGVGRSFIELPYRPENTCNKQVHEADCAQAKALIGLTYHWTRKNT